MRAATIVPNLMKRRLAAGDAVLNFRILLSRSIDIIKIARASGHHAVLIDLQHSSMALDTCCQMASAALDAGVTPIVRIPFDRLSEAAAILDGGAQALLIPGIETAEDAEKAVHALRYPLRGSRSVTTALPHAGFVRLPPADLAERLDQETMLLIQIESGKAVDNAAAIAAVDGVDMLVTGTNDLCAELGLFGQHGHERIEAIHDHLLAVCRAANKPLVAGGIGSREILARYIRLGAAPLFLTGSDTDFLIAGAQAAATAFGSIGTGDGQ